VGTGQDTTLMPRNCTTGFLNTYKILEDGRSLELLHKVSLPHCPKFVANIKLIPTFLAQTETDDVPTALIAFQGRLVAGVGKALRIYDMGKKKLLRKTENNVNLFTSFVVQAVTHHRFAFNRPLPI
jgi:splicing factor 3B subunit 3